MKLERRIGDIERLDARAAVLGDTGEDAVIESDIRETIRDVFGADSPEFHEHEHLRIWAGPMWMGMPGHTVVQGKEKGKVQAIAILRGLIRRLQEKREELHSPGGGRRPSAYWADLNIHPRIAEVATDLFLDGHPWEAVFAASKALVNYVKEKSGRHDLDGAALMRQVFSRKAPVLAFNTVASQTEQDEQEGMMHLFEGAVLAIRNPGGHSFPQGPEERAIEYLQLLSFLAYRVQAARRVAT